MESVAPTEIETQSKWIGFLSNRFEPHEPLRDVSRDSEFTLSRSLGVFCGNQSRIT